MNTTVTYPRALTVKEVGQILNLGNTKAYELVRSNVFPVIKIGRSIRIPFEPFNEWLNNSKFN